MFRALLFLIVLQINIPFFAQNADINLLRKINVNRDVSLDPAFKLTSQSVTPLSIAMPLTVFVAGELSGNKTTINYGLKAGLAQAASMVISTTMKYTIRRERPYIRYPDIQPLMNDHTSSFPSGHTTSAFCTATSLSLMSPKWYVIVPSYSWAVFVGYSRMHLGMHYPSDVIMGAIIGTGVSFLSFKVQRWIGN